MLRNIVFDLGNVLLDYLPEEHLKARRVAPEHIPSLMEGIFRSEEWVRLDLGTLTEAEAVERWVGRLDCPEALVRDVVDHWREMLTPIEDTVGILERLKKSEYGLCFLSNFHEAAFETVSARHGFFRLFDGGVVSCRVQRVKPDAEIFRHLVESCGIQPEESVFIDDVEANVEGAERCGFQGIRFTSPQNLLESLRGLGIPI